MKWKTNPHRCRNETFYLPMTILPALWEGDRASDLQSTPAWAWKRRPFGRKKRSL